MKIVERIFLVLENKNIKQKDFAKMINISTANISAWKNRNTNPPIELAIDIAKALEVSLYWLLTGTEDKNISNKEIEIINDIRKLNQQDLDEIIEIIKMKTKRMELKNGFQESKTS